MHCNDHEGNRENHHVHRYNLEGNQHDRNKLVAISLFFREENFSILFSNRAESRAYLYLLEEAINQNDYSVKLVRHSTMTVKMS